MANRQTEARNAALTASRLSSRLLDLSDLDKWYEERVNNARKLRDEVVAQVDALFDSMVQQSPVVYVPVGECTGPSKFNGLWYDIALFVGGIQDNGIKRPNGKRHFNKEGIKDTTQPGFLGVDRKWLFDPVNVDVLTYVKTFPQSVTKL